MKCFECPSMGYLKEDSYYCRWCGERNKCCADVWPKTCPWAAKEKQYEEAKAAYDKRFSMGVQEYYAWCAKTAKKVDINESAEYAKKFAGTTPKKEDFL